MYCVPQCSMYLCARYDEDKFTSDVVGLIGCIFLPYVELVNNCCSEYIVMFCQIFEVPFSFSIQSHFLRILEVKFSGFIHRVFRVHDIKLLFYKGATSYILCDLFIIDIISLSLLHFLWFNFSASRNTVVRQSDCEDLTFLGHKKTLDCKEIQNFLDVG